MIIRHPLCMIELRRMEVLMVILRGKVGHTILTRHFCVASGMDRYGITAPQSTSNILKHAKELDAHEQSTDWNTVFKNSSDMAYFLNENKEKTYSETQGFTNGKLRVANTTRETPNTEATTKASQVNEGAITEYPYKIDKTITVAATHFQYYQLALEENADEVFR